MRAARSLLTILLLLALPRIVQAGCNLIPGTTASFNGVLGTTDRPYAAPGERVAVALRSCDAAGSPGLSLTTGDYVVTVAFPGSGTNALRVLSPDADCDALAHQLAACDLPPAMLACVADATAGLATVEREGHVELGFRFPDTDDAVGTPSDDRTLAGPARIAVTRRTDPLPCNLAAVPCAAQSGLVACIDDFFVNDGSCGTGIPNPEFASFTALPPPNDYQRDCFLDPPCNPTAPELRAALDASGNVLMPIAWQGILVPQARVPVPRLLSTAISAPVGFPVQIPAQVFLTSFTPEGKRLGPIFEPQLDQSASTSDFVRFFGSTDAPYTILRVARHHGTCSAGANAGARCATILDCPGGTCATSCVGNPALPCATDGDCGGAAPCGALYDLAGASTAGGLYLDRAAPRRCQLTPYQACSGPGDCPGAFNACVGYSIQANTPVPLDGLAASPDLRSFVVEEAIDGVQRNGDTDLLDAVAILRDRATGVVQPLGAPDGFAVGGAPLPACGLAGTPEGRAAVRVQDGVFSFPAVAVENDVLAFLESEAAQNYCDENGDYDRADAILRVFKLGAGEVTASLSPPRVVDPAPRINGQGLMVASGEVFYRRPETGAAQQTTGRANLGPGGVEASAGGGSTNAGLGISADGRYVAFSSTSANLLGPGGDTNGAEDVFVRDRVAGTTTRVSVGPGGLEANGTPFVGSGFVAISADGQHVAFASDATNLLGPGGDTNGFIDVFVHDLGTGVTERVSVGPGGLEGDGHSVIPALSADGRFVVFASDATNLLGPGGDTNGNRDVFVRDRLLGTTERVDVGPGGAEPPSGSGEWPAISADGRYVAFTSTASNLLDPGLDTNGVSDVFVRDRQTGANERVSIGPGGIESNGASGFSRVTMSADGRFVAFESGASNLTAEADVNGATDAFVHDRLTGVTTLVGRGPGGTSPDAPPTDVTISPDGRYVAFYSSATNLLGAGLDTNGAGDIFLSDRESGVTTRVNVGLAGEEATGGGGTVNGFLGLSRDAREVAFLSDATNLVGVGNDTNGFRDVFVHGTDPADPLGADALFADGALDDTVLEVLDSASATTTTLCPADDVAVASDGTAVFLRPESAVGTGACPGGSLNPPDADTTDDVVQLWEGGSVVNLARAATAVAASTSGLAALVSECGTAGAVTTGCPDGGTDLNGDGDAGDDVVAVNALPGATAGSWISTGQAGEALAINGDVVGFLTSEAVQGGALLNADVDATDRVLQVYSLAGTPLACTPTGPGAPSCTAGVRVAADDFVLGAPAVTTCGARQLVAFSANEAAENATNLNGGVGVPADVDTLDDVLQVYDAVSGELKNVRQAVTPCRLAACDPREPYKIDGSKVTFLTLEAEQGGQDLSVEGFPGDLVIQVYDFCTETVTVIGRVDPGGQDPLRVPEDTRVFLAPAGRCDLAIPCGVDADCGAGSFCDLDTCATATGTCTRYTGLACATDVDCRRCILRQPATCRPEVTTPPDCPSGASCLPTLVTAVTTPADADDDGVPDAQDDCPEAFDPSQSDTDGDGTGDACDVQTCGDGVLELAEECDDGNTASGDGCSSDCLRECAPAPLAGCRLPAVAGKASLLLKDKSPDAKDQLAWKWARGAVTTKADFGQPLTTDRYELCLYDATGLVTTAIVPPGGFCAKGKACWREKKTGFDYKDGDLTPDGVAQLQLREGLVAGKAKIQVKGKGDRLDMPPSLAALLSPVRVQLVNHATGTCWESVFSAPFKKQDATTFAAKAD